METKEHKIGEVFERKGKKIKIELDNPSRPCSGCYRKVKGKCNAEYLMRNGELEPCTDYRRTDGKDVIFKKIKDMNEENSNKDEHFYIWGVPNRGEEVKELLKNKSINCTLEQDDYSDKNALIYIEDEETISIYSDLEPSLCNLITSNWTEIKLPYKPKDKEFVWAWDNDFCVRILGFYSLKNNCLFSFEGKRVGCSYDHYKSYEGEYPQWAKETLAKLEE